MKTSLLCLLLLCQVGAYAKINGPKRYDYKGLTGYVSTEVYMAEENFDSDGKVSKLPSSGEYMLVDVPFGFRYVFGANVGIESELKASYAQSKSSDPLVGATRTNSRLHEIRVSADYLFETPNFDLIPEFEVIFPFEDIDTNSDDALLNEGVRSLVARLHLQTEFGNTDFFSFIGYQNRDDGRSNLLPWSAGLGWQAARSFYGARVFGFRSISDDEDKDFPIARETYIGTVNAGAARFYGVNPSSVAAEGLMFFKIGQKWEMQLNAGLDLAGESYSKGYFAGATFVLDFGQGDGFVRRRKVIKTSTPQPRGSGLAVDSDSVEFREATTQQEREQEYFTPPQPPSQKPKPRKSGPSDKQLQESLDDVEMQIELKKKKSR